MNMKNFIEEYVTKEQARNIEVSFSPILVGVEVDEQQELSDRDVYSLAIEQLMANPQLVIDHMLFTLLPEDTLTTKQAFVGRLVRHSESDLLGVIVNVNRQLVTKPLRVAFIDGSVERFNFYELSIVREFPSDEVAQFQTLPFTDVNEIEDGGVYLVSTPSFNGIGIAKFNHKKGRASISRLTIRERRIAERMSINEMNEYIRVANPKIEVDVTSVQTAL